MTPFPRLELRSLYMQIAGRAILRDVSLRLAEGETVVVTGANGAGKSTLLDVIGGDAKPDRGEVLLDDRSLGELPSWRRARRGMFRLYQDIGTFTGLTIAESLNVAPLACGQGILRPQDERGHLADLGLEVPLEQSCAALSVGQMRLIAIARILAAVPKLMLLDEPAAGLSGTSKKILAARLSACAAVNGCSLLVVEHDAEFLATLIGRRLLLHDGLLQEV